MDGVNCLAPDIGVARACRAMRVDRSAVYRERIGARRLVTHSAPALDISLDVELQ